LGTGGVEPASAKTARPCLYSASKRSCTAALALLACGGTPESQPTDEGSTTSAWPYDDAYASAIGGAIASARTRFQEGGYVIKGEDAHGFVVTTQGGPDESRVDGHAQFGGDPFLVADIPLDADPDFRAEVHECLAPWGPGEPPDEPNLP
jgi:hypothetical protein